MPSPPGGVPSILLTECALQLQPSHAPPGGRQGSPMLTTDITTSDTCFKCSPRGPGPRHPDPRALEAPVKCPVSSATRVCLQPVWEQGPGQAWLIPELLPEPPGASRSPPAGAAGHRSRMTIRAPRTLSREEEMRDRGCIWVAPHHGVAT